MKPNAEAISIPLIKPSFPVPHPVWAWTALGPDGISPYKPYLSC